MRKRAALAVMGLLVLLAATVQAITFGQNDNGRHPFVGSLVLEFQGTKFQLCSGTLVSPTVQSDTHDVAVFVLDKPVKMRNYGQLPTAGLLDAVAKQAARFTTVGYGTVRDDKTRSFQSFELGTRRKVATQDMESLMKAWVQFSMNPSTGSGGTCFGDSGGPHFLGAGASETRVVVAVTVTGDRFCRATDKAYRLDTPSARSFLEDFVTLP